MKYSLLVTALLGFFTFANAEQTATESAAAHGKQAGRSLKKGVNRLKENTCLKDDAECAAERAGNRLKEGGTALKDKTKETVDKAD